MSAISLYEALNVELTNTWGEWGTARCPWPENHKHGDRTPSARIDLESGYLKCHGCGKQGNVWEIVLDLLEGDRAQTWDLLVEHGLREENSPRSKAQVPRLKAQGSSNVGSRTERAIRKRVSSGLVSA